MKRMALLVLLLVTLFALAACGRNEVDEADLPTPVAVYTRDAASADTEAQAASEVAVATNDAATADEDAAETDQEDGTHEGAAQEQAADADTEAASADGADEDSAAQDAESAENEAGAEGEDQDVQGEAADAEAQAEAEATAVPEPTATTPPTATPEPTATAEPTPTTAPTATPEPTTAPEPTAAPASASSDDAVADEFAGVPEGVAALIPGADVTRGEQLTLQNACIGCHNMDPNVPMAGPTWYNMAETAATRVEGESAPAYLYNSIVHPNDYLVEGYVAGVMIQTYGDTLSEQDLADIIAYLLTLHGE